MTPELSIIVPVYYNAESLFPLYERISSYINTQMTFEVIFIDDGSGDNSFNELLRLKSRHPDTIKIIKFSRNFGQVPAIMAGYVYAQGNFIINISADLQDPPELIPQMVAASIKNDSQIIICTREEREEGIYRRYTSRLFYNLTKNLSFKNMPKGGFDYALITKKVKDLIIENHDANPFWQGLILSTGFKPELIFYKREKRKFGKSRWTLSKKIKYLIDAVFNYSFMPIRLITILGFLISLISFLYGISIIILKIMGHIPLQGWAPIMVVLLFLSGIQMIMLGVIGEYVWRTMEQVKKKTLFVIDKII